MDWKIPLFKIHWDEEDVEAINSVVRRGMSWAIGPEIEEFEKAIACYMNVNYCVTFNSGTSALHAAMIAYGIGRGDEVIVPSFTFIATANAVLFVGARPVFADILESTCGLSPMDVEDKITHRTKAIIPVHYGGCPCEMDVLKEIADEHRLMLIEDAAESMGASINGTMVGSIGDSGILSFCQSKLMTTGEGGAVITNNKDIYNKLKLIRSHGRQEDVGYFETEKYLDYITLGYNFRLSSMSAALGISQLKKLPKLIEMRQKNAKLLTDRLSGQWGIITPQPQIGLNHVYQMYSIRVLYGERNGLMQHLTNDGIMSKVFFYPVHRTYFYHYDFNLPMTDWISSQTLSLPMYPDMTEEEIDMVVNSVINYFKGDKNV